MEEATGDLNWKGMGTMRISRDLVQWLIAGKGRGEGKAITVITQGTMYFVHFLYANCPHLTQTLFFLFSVCPFP